MTEEIRVFELAKELNMPAKQLLKKIRKAGVPATGNFSELSIDQAELIRNVAKNKNNIETNHKDKSKYT